MGKNIGLILKSPNADLRFKHGVQLTLQILQHALPHIGKEPDLRLIQRRPIRMLQRHFEVNGQIINLDIRNVNP